MRAETAVNWIIERLQPRIDALTKRVSEFTPTEQDKREFMSMIGADPDSIKIAGENLALRIAQGEREGLIREQYDLLPDLCKLTFEEYRLYTEKLQNLMQDQAMVLGAKIMELIDPRMMFEQLLAGGALALDDSDDEDEDGEEE